MKRTALFLAINLAVVLVLSVSMPLLGGEPFLNEQGLNFQILLVFTAVTGFGGVFVSLALSRWSATSSAGARLVRMPEEIWPIHTLARPDPGASIRMPAVAVYDPPEGNGLATGMTKNHSLVAVSTGLLQRMPPGEVEWVLAHKMSHAAKGDRVTSALIQGVVSTFVLVLSPIIRNLVDRVVLRTEQGNGPVLYITRFLGELVRGILATLIRMWHPHPLGRHAGAGGAARARRPNLIDALKHLGNMHPLPLPDKMGAFGTAGSLDHALKRLFMTQPPWAKPIAALEAARQGGHG